MTDVPSITSSPFSPRIGRLRPKHLREFVFFFLLSSPPVHSIHSFSPSSLSHSFSLSPTRGFFLCSLLSYPVLISSLPFLDESRRNDYLPRPDRPFSVARSQNDCAIFLFPFHPLSLSLFFAFEGFRRIENEGRKLEDNSYIFRDDRKNGEGRGARGFGSTRSTPVYIA